MESEPDLELTDLIVPAQYYAALRRGKCAFGEARLMLAILMDAINCILGARSQAQLRHEAWAWISGGTGAVSFVDACEASGVEPNALRAAIEKLTHNESKRKAALKLLTRRDAHDRIFSLSGYSKR